MKKLILVAMLVAFCLIFATTSDKGWKPLSGGPIHIIDTIVADSVSTWYWNVPTRDHAGKYLIWHGFTNIDGDGAVKTVLQYSLDNSIMGWVGDTTIDSINAVGAEDTATAVLEPDFYPEWLMTVTGLGDSGDDSTIVEYIIFPLLLK